MLIMYSYERLMPKSWNSSYLCWGLECKELTIRACCPPGAPDGVVTNFEIKTFDRSANPHLGLACIIIAGIDGLRRNLPIPDPVGKLDDLPVSIALPLLLSFGTQDVFLYMPSNLKQMRFESGNHVNLYLSVIVSILCDHQNKSN